MPNFAFSERIYKAIKQVLICAGFPVLRLITPIKECTFG